MAAWARRRLALPESSNDRIFVSPALKVGGAAWVVAGALFDWLEVLPAAS